MRRGIILSLWATSITLDNFHNKILGITGGLDASNQVHGAKTIHAFVGSNNIYVAATSLLKISDGFSTSTNNQSNSAIRNHNLHAVFTFTQHRLRWKFSTKLLRRCRLLPAAVRCATIGVTVRSVVFFNDSEYLSLSIISSTKSTRNTT